MKRRVDVGHDRRRREGRSLMLAATVKEAVADGEMEIPQDE
jgi:hypothetical protein